MKEYLNISNTTNTIDDHFSDLKNKLRNHNGLSKKENSMQKIIKIRTYSLPILKILAKTASFLSIIPNKILFGDPKKIN